MGLFRGLDSLLFTSTSALLILKALPTSMLGMRSVNFPSKSSKSTRSLFATWIQCWVNDLKL